MTELSAELVTPMCMPSNAILHGWRPTGKVPSVAPVSDSSVTLLLLTLATHRPRSWPRDTAGDILLTVQAFDLPPVPLREDDHGVIRVAGSRVTLDSVVVLFDRGATPEEIVQSFPTLHLGDVYTILRYVVVRRSDVDTYLARRAVEEDAAREEAQLRSCSLDLRVRLLARPRGSAA